MNQNEEIDDLRSQPHSEPRSWMVPVAGISSLLAVAAIAVLASVPVQAKLGNALSTPPTKTTRPLVSSPTPEALSQSRESSGAEREAHWTDRLRGHATWYGGVLNGRLTASGERFDMYAMTACHPTLPFGSLVRVSDKHTHRSVVVRINDRGMLAEGRIIDLSYGAAGELGIISSGVASVTLHVIRLGEGRGHMAKLAPNEKSRQPTDRSATQIASR